MLRTARNDGAPGRWTFGRRTWDVGRGRAGLKPAPTFPPQPTSKPLSPLWRGAPAAAGWFPPQGAPNVQTKKAPLFRGRTAAHRRRGVPRRAAQPPS
ncbi:MAG: hypothetical protein LBM98_03145 [Oscillospiraceae bacterium]|nr:hypothetical protein [Oscillospiraceae bacterium]